MGISTRSYTFYTFLKIPVTQKNSLNEPQNSPNRAQILSVKRMFTRLDNGKCIALACALTSTSFVKLKGRDTILEWVIKIHILDNVLVNYRQQQRRKLALSLTFLPRLSSAHSLKKGRFSGAS